MITVTCDNCGEEIAYETVGLIALGEGRYLHFSIGPLGEDEEDDDYEPPEHICAHCLVAVATEALERPATPTGLNAGELEEEGEDD